MCGTVTFALRHRPSCDETKSTASRGNFREHIHHMASFAHFASFLLWWMRIQTVKYSYGLFMYGRADFLGFFLSEEMG